MSNLLGFGACGYFCKHGFKVAALGMQREERKPTIVDRAGHT